MADAKEKIESSSTALDAASTDEEINCTTVDGKSFNCEPKKRTVGNRIFDWGVYSSIAWLGVSAASLLTAHEAVHGTNKNFKWLRTLDEKITSGFTHLFKKTPVKPENVEGWAKSTSLFTMLGLGGSTLMVPIKWLEDNRQRMAGKIDNALGTTPPDPELIAHEPKQSWKSVFAGRMASVVLGYGTFIFIGPKISSQISERFGGKFTQMWMKQHPTHNENTVRRWANLGVFDTFYTAVTASVMYLFSRFVAKQDPEALAAKAALANETLVETSDAPTKSFAAQIGPRPKTALPEASHGQRVLASADQNVTPAL